MRIALCLRNHLGIPHMHLKVKYLDYFACQFLLDFDRQTDRETGRTDKQVDREKARPSRLPHYEKLFHSFSTIILSSNSIVRVRAVDN